MPNEKDQQQSQEEGFEEKKYSFLQETIKSKPMSREQVVKQIIRIALYGVILGVFACLGFFALRPWAQSWFRGDPETVTIPEDEEPAEEQEDVQAAEEETVPILTAESYEEMLASMNERAAEAGKCVVSVEAVTDEDDWNAQMTGVGNGSSGVITADNGQELLILADNSVCEGAAEWTVTFQDGKSCGAALKKQDKNTGLAMFSIPRTSISESTWSNIKVAALGNSNLVVQGDAVMALGNMFGYPDGMGYGLISSTDYKEAFFDGGCDVLATDIPVSSDGTGFLFNMEGEVIGLISGSVWDDSGNNTANACAISDLKSVIELMANGQSVPYIGIYGTTVTTELKENQGMPAGIYVVDVDPDSPAMAAGIQSGDIICRVSDTDVSSIVTYREAVLETRAGTDVRIRGQRLGAGGYVDVDFTVTVGSKE